MTYEIVSPIYDINLNKKVELEEIESKANLTSLRNVPLDLPLFKPTGLS